MKYITTVGIEYTYQHKNPYLHYEIAKQFNIKGFSQAYDDDCVEIPTPIHKTKNEMVKYYTELQKHVKLFELKTHFPNVMSGGGDIHLGLQNFKYTFKRKFLLNLLSDYYNRPYINWIFNDPVDDINANHLLYYKWNNEKTPEIKQLAIDNLKTRKVHFITFSFNKKEYELMINNKMGPIKNWSEEKGLGVLPRFSYNTVEFRFFDAPRTLQQVNDHVDFVTAYFSYIKKATIQKKEICLVIDTRKKMKRFTYEVAKKEFNEMLKLLGLCPKRYSKYVKRNLHKRYEYKTLV